MRRHTGSTGKARVRPVPVSLLERRLPPIERLHHDGLRIGASFEFFPPKTPELSARLQETAALLRPLEPEFVSVTFGAGGSTRERTVETVLDLVSQGFSTAAHLTCVGSSRAEIQELARGYREAGVAHVVALRGDLPPGVEPGSTELPHASDLVALLHESGFPEISVAAFPEGHPESDFSQAREIENLKRKEAAGATRAITQFVFDNALYLRFVDRAEAAGVTIPIIPGILPITELPVVRSFAKRVGRDGAGVARPALRRPRRRPARARARLGQPRRRAVRRSGGARRAPRALLHAKPRQPHPRGVPAASGRSGDLAPAVAPRPAGRPRG